MSKVGRPKQMPPPERQITPEKAVEIIAQHRKKFGRKGVTKGHLYNLIGKKLHRWGPPKLAILDLEEVKQVFGLVG
jgi:hypothetical protein